MILNRITRLKLLTEIDQLPHVLAAFPEKVAAGLVRDVTEMLLNHRRDSNDLSTQTHVDWVMQVVGHGFALPLNNAGLIESCILIYSQWLLELHTRPTLFSLGGDEQLFIQRILLSLSQTFDFRPGIPPIRDGHSANSPESVGAVQRYVDLSKHVIALYASVGRALGASMSKTTWKVLVTCLLGAVDHFLGFEGMASLASSIETEPLSPALLLATEVLCDPLLRTFLEVWLRSGICEVDLWKTLEENFGHWVQRPLVVSHWNAVTLALTRSLVQRTYNNDTTNKDITINTNGYNLNLALSDDALAVLWYKYLFLLNPKTSMPNASHALALQGIARVVEQMDIPSEHRPAGNTILRVVGTWLFGAKSSEARGTALAVLCYLFSRRPLGSFAEKYRQDLFECLDEGLSMGQDAQPIFLHGSGLLGQPAAALVLLPKLVTAIRTVVPTLSPGFRLAAPLDQVRRGILRCIAAVLLIPTRFPDVQLSADLLPAGYINLPYGMDVLVGDTAVLHFGGFTSYLLQVLTQFLSSETDAANFRLTLDLLTLFTAQMPPAQQEILVNGLILAITAQVIRSSSGIHLALACFEVAGRLLEGQALKPDYCPEPAWGLVEAITAYVCRFLKEDDFEYSFQAIVAAYLALARWAEALSHAGVPLPSCVTTAFHAVCQGLAVGGNSESDNVSLRQRNPLATLPQRHSRSKTNPSSPNSFSPPDLTLNYDMGGVQIFLAARLALAKFIKLFHRDSQTHDKNTARDIPLAHDQLKGDSDHAVQYFFLYPDTVMGVCESLKDRQACVVTRDPFGISCFQVSPTEETNSRLSQIRPTPLSPPVPPNPTPLEGPSLVDAPAQFQEALEPTPSLSIPESPHKLDSVIAELVEAQISDEIFAQKQARLHRLPHAPPLASDISSGQRIARQLLTQLGFINEGECLAPLPLNSNLLGTLALLDRLPTRINVPICLLYTASPLSTLASLHRTPEQGLSEPFLALLQSLTPGQSLKDTRPYCANAFADFTLTCPYLDAQPAATSIGTIGQPSITVLYYDALSISAHACNPDLASHLLTVVGGLNAFLILVAPEIENGDLYRIRLAGPTNLMNQESHPWVGPLSDDVVVTRDSLSQLIKSTALSIKLNQLASLEIPHSKSPDSVPNPWLSPYLSRASILAHINDMASHRTPSEPSTHFFSTLLRPIPQSSNSPNDPVPA